MRMFWKIEGTRKTLYTAKAIQYAKHRRTGEIYYRGEGKLYKKKDYPKNLIENELFKSDLKTKYLLYYGVPMERQPDRIEKLGWGRVRKVYSSVHPYQLEKEYLDLFGFWIVEGTETPLYTESAADIIRDKRTGVEYKRGEFVLFHDEDDTPFPIAEHTDNYEYIYIRGGTYTPTTKDYTREIWANGFLRNLFGKRK